MEKRDLYDKNRKLTGETIFKGKAIPDGRYIIVVLVFMQNSKGELLIQKRSKEKDGLYGSTGGHAKSGENSIQGIMSEIQEEIGLNVSEEELELIYSDREDSEQVFFDVYYMKTDINISDLVLQKEEVESVEWLSIEEIKELAKQGLVLSNHVEELYRLEDILEKRIKNIK